MNITLFTINKINKKWLNKLFVMLRNTFIHVLFYEVRGKEALPCIEHVCIVRFILFN